MEKKDKIKKKQKKILNEKLNSGYWEEGPRRNRTFLPVENYSTVLGKDFVFEETYTGKDKKHGCQLLASYYYSPQQDMVVAQVISKKENGTILKQLNISTYCVHQDKVLMINRFDLKGSAHNCNFAIYSGKEKELYEKYFTDFIQDGVHKARAPHIHFQTQTQARNLMQPNPISLDNLIIYLSDLDSGNEDLLHYDLGMPFLDYKLGNKEYVSPLLPLMKSIIKNSEENEITLLMQRLIETTTGQGAIAEIKRDIIFLKEFIAIEDNQFLNSVVAFKFISSLLHNNLDEQAKAEEQLLNHEKFKEYIKNIKEYIKDKEEYKSHVFNIFGKNTISFLSLKKISEKLDNNTRATPKPNYLNELWVEEFKIFSKQQDLKEKYKNFYGLELEKKLKLYKSLKKFEKENSGLEK